MIGKKVLSSILAAGMILSCAACRKTSETSHDSTTTTRDTGISSRTTTESTSENVTTSSSEETSLSSEESSVSSEETTASTSAPASSEVPSARKNLSSIQYGKGKTDEMTEKLLKLEGVISAEKTIDSTVVPPSDQTISKYYVIFEMPMDWNAPEKGTFPLRTYFTYISDDAPNTFQCDGYNLSDYVMEIPYRSEVADRYNTNFIECEHRFFGTSIPEGLSNESLQYWEYLTDENAAHDFHFIIEQFKTLFSGKWIFTGGSKGGQLTHMQSHFYPDDCDLYFSFVAPGGVSQDAPDFFDHIYNDIGNDRYGENTAKIHREEVLRFQVEAMKLKEKLAPRYYQLGIQQGCHFTDFTTPEILYDMAVLEAATITWQYVQDFVTIKQILDMDRNSSFEEEVFKYLVWMNEPSVWANSDSLFAYYVQAAKQNGEHEYDFSFLREALRKEGLENLLTVTEDMEKGLLFKMVFTPEQLQAFTFNPTVYNDMVEWSHTTKTPVIMVYGGADVWYSVRLPDVTDNENIHIYVAKKASHMATLHGLSNDEQARIDQIVKGSLGI